MRRSARAAVAVLAFALAATPACAGPPVNLTGAGATFPFPLYSKWLDAYARDTGVQINYQSIGSGGGIRQILARTVDFGASDGPMTDEMLRGAPAPILHIPTVAGAVAVAYNLAGVPSGLRLTPDVLAGIYLGKIAKWSDPRITALNPTLKLPDAPVVVAHRADGSGTTNIFTDYLSKVSPEWKEKVGAGTSVNWPAGLGGKGNEGVTGLVKQNGGAVGYVELAYALQNRLTVAQVRNQAGRFVPPSLSATTAAMAAFATRIPADYRVLITNAPGRDSYPISGFTWILVYKEQADRTKGEALVKFLWWAVHEGQRYAPPLLYAPLPKALVARIEATLKSITYQGTPLLP